MLLCRGATTMYCSYVKSYVGAPCSEKDISIFPSNEQK
jgi:hypothetical protein